MELLGERICLHTSLRRRLGPRRVALDGDRPVATAQVSGHQGNPGARWIVTQITLA